MLYLNQRDYRHIPFMHDLDNGGVPPARRNVATSGCGICVLCMIVDHLTTKTLELEACVRLAETRGANRRPGCSIRTLGPVVAELYDLDFCITASREEFLAHLHAGGEAAVLVHGAPDGPGIFCTIGHWILAVAADGDEVCLLDPHLTPGKYKKPEAQGLVRFREPFIYCSAETLENETRCEWPYYLFRRK